MAYDQWGDKGCEHRPDKCDHPPDDCMWIGDSVDQPKITNFTQPTPTLTVNGMALDMTKIVEVAERLGMVKGDVISIGGHRNAKNVWVPDYDSVRIEKRADHE